MGMFEALCSESGLPLGGDAALFLGARSTDKTWAPISLPLIGCYDRNGSIDLPDTLDENGSILHQFLRDSDEAVAGQSLSEALCRLSSGGRAVDGLEVSYALLDRGIYFGIYRTVARGGRPEWSSAGDGALDSLHFDTLLGAAFANPETARSIYQPLTPERQAWMRPILKNLVRLRVWNCRLAPLDRDLDETHQISGYSGQTSGNGAAQPFVEAARRKYAEFPLLLKAVDQAAGYWSSLEQQT